jgi:hypothetical protein
LAITIARHAALIAIVCFWVAAAASAAPDPGAAAEPAPAATPDTPPADSPAPAAPPKQAPTEAQSIEAWDHILTVLQSPRCLNCHQEKAPLQGEDRHPHIPAVERGPDGLGVAPLRCDSCHNTTAANPGGAPFAGSDQEWRLAPASMAWQGLSSGDLCRALKDRERNGGRDGAALIEHVETAPLVRWGLHPTNGLARPPLAAKEFIQQWRIWTEGGERCPS